MKNRPIDAVNMGALPDTAPPKSKYAPKKAMTREEAEARMRGERPKPADRMEMNKEYSGKVQRYFEGGRASRPSGIRGDAKLDKNSKSAQREIDAFTKYFTENPEAKPKRTLQQRRVDGLGVSDFDRAEESGYAAAKKKYAKGGSVRGDGMCSKGHTKGRMV